MMTEDSEQLIPHELPEQILEEQAQETAENPSTYEEAQADLDEIELQREEGKEPLEDVAKAAWEEQDEEEEVQAGVVVGLSPLGPVVQVVSPNGDRAQKVVSVEELYLLGGQMIGIASFIMQMGMQAQMQEQARIQALMEKGEEKTASGLYVKRN
jgi:hypothetical protein